MEGFHWYKVINGIVRDNMEPPWAGISSRGETCLGVQTKRRDVNVWNSQVLDRIGIDPLEKIANGRPSPDLDRHG